MPRISLLERLLFWVAALGALYGLVAGFVGQLFFSRSENAQEIYVRVTEPALYIGMTCCAVLLVMVALLALRSKKL